MRSPSCPSLQDQVDDVLLTGGRAEGGHHQRTISGGRASSRVTTTSVPRLGGQPGGVRHHSGRTSCATGPSGPSGACPPAYCRPAPTRVSSASGSAPRPRRHPPDRPGAGAPTLAETTCPSAPTTRTAARRRRTGTERVESSSPARRRALASAGPIPRRIPAQRRAGRRGQSRKSARNPDVVRRRAGPPHLVGEVPFRLDEFVEAGDRSVAVGCGAQCQHTAGTASDPEERRGVDDLVLVVGPASSRRRRASPLHHAGHNEAGGRVGRGRSRRRRTDRPRHGLETADKGRRIQAAHRQAVPRLGAHPLGSSTFRARCKCAAPGGS